MNTETPQGPDEVKASQFTFADRIKADTVRSRFNRTSTLAAIPLMMGVVALVVYLQEGSISIELSAPEVSYALLPNEGRTSGVPVVIKVNQIAVFMIHDPLDQGAGAVRAKESVDQLQKVIDMAVDEPGKTLRIDNESNELPTIVLTKEDGTESQLVVAIMKEDLVLAGDNDAKRVARTWAERLTDTLKVLAFGEEPKFTSGSDFWAVLHQMYTGAMMEKGLITNDSLNESFETLPPRQRLILETLPTQAPDEIGFFSPSTDISGE